MIDDGQRREFWIAVWDYYHDHGRYDLPWRHTTAPYHIMVSELMLQQTQVSRVIPKYHEFLQRFPAVESLAQAELGEVLRAWSGLGYNRRAKFLHQAARAIMQDFAGHFPQQASDLIKLPGIGPNTAGAILAYAYNQPVVFIETNIRTVYIHHFFHDQTDIPDKSILPLVAETLDRQQPRVWYWALMDYGTYLKQTVGNLNRRSKHYARQSAFHGSRRQIRGQIIRLLSEQPQTKNELQNHIADERLETVLAELLAEKLIHHQSKRYHL